MRGIHKRFILPTGAPLDILTGVDLVIQPGEVVAIVGRSGSGKSTLLNILGLLEPPTDGEYVLDGASTEDLGDRQRARLRGAFFGFIFQQFHLLDRRTALENVAEPLLYAPANQLRSRMPRAAALLDAVGLSERAHSMPHLLSGGEQQRVAIARALVRAPRLILADEPTGALDTATGASVLHLLLELVRSEDVAMIVVTHEQSVAAQADRVLTLTNGALEAAT